MSRHFGRFAKTFLILMLCLGGLCEAGAQSPPEFNRIASVVEDASGKFVLVRTHLARPVPAPNIQYLPGGDGETVLVADFPGIVIKGQPRVFAPPVEGLQQIHIGQFQENPPILRMAFTATRPSVLRKLSFNASAGTLIINLPDKDPAAAPAKTAAAPAPSSNYPAVQYQPVQAPPAARPYRQPASPEPAPRVEARRPPAVYPGQPSKSSALPARLAMTPHMPVNVPSRSPAPARLAPPDNEASEQQTPQARPTNRGILTRMFTHKPAPGKTETARPEDVPRAAAGAGSAAAGPPATPPAPAPPSAASGSAPILPAPARLAAQTFTIRPPAAPVREGQRNERQPGQAPVDPVAGMVAALPFGLRPALPTRPDAVPPRQQSQLQPARPPADPVQAGESVQQPPPATSPSGAAQPESRTEDPLGTGISVRGAGPVRIDVSGATPFTYKSFRLHDPERQVIDIQGLPELVGVTVPEPEPNPYVTSVRVGNPDGDPSTVRVVLDLSSAEVDVKETNVQARNLLAIFVEKGGMPIEDIRVPAGMSVVIDAGHGGSDPGAQRGDIKEKELTLAITDKLRKALEANNVKVTMTRSDDTFVSLADRVTLTNGVSPHAFVSVHINSLETNSTINGIETYYQTEHSKELARSIHDCLVSKLSAPDRSIRRARFYVINHTPVPAVLAEVGFISNKEERSKLISSDYQQEIANAVARGVILYLSRRTDLAQAAPGQDRAAAGRSETAPAKAPDIKPQSLAEARPAAPRQSKP